MILSFFSFFALNWWPDLIFILALSGDLSIWPMTGADLTDFLPSGTPDNGMILTIPLRLPWLTQDRIERFLFLTSCYRAWDFWAKTERKSGRSWAGELGDDELRRWVLSISVGVLHSKSVLWWAHFFLLFICFRWSRSPYPSFLALVLIGFSWSFDLH